MNPSILHFSRFGAAWKMLLCLAIIPGLLWIVAEMDSEAPAPPAPSAPPPSLSSGPLLTQPAAKRVDSFAPVRILILLGGTAFLLFGVFRHGRRALFPVVAASLEGGSLHFDLSYVADGAPVALDDVLSVRFGRGDVVAEEGGEAIAPGGARMGARLRHVLLIEHRVDGRREVVRIVDNDIDGGSEQLRRFGAFVQAHRGQVLDD